MTSGDSAKVSVFVAISPGDAFEVFTNEIDLWWKQGPAYRIAGKRPGQLNFEPGPGGRLFETYEVHGQPRSFEIGRVTAWEPPRLLVFEWRGINFRPDEKTVVEVRFASQGQGTLVSVEHRGWSALPDDHPVRHGQTGLEFIRTIGMWWGGLMTSLRDYVAGKEEKS
jgi:uncharacterized protein YndB with AHSA1/START domain